MKLAAVPASIGFPHAHLAVGLIRRRRLLTSRRWHTETVYAITDPIWSEIRAGQITEAIRGHWALRTGCTDMLTALPACLAESVRATG